MVPGFVPQGIAYRTPEEKAQIESRNGIIQANFVLNEIESWTVERRVGSEIFCKLQELAITQIYRCAGHFRNGPVLLTNSAHQSPGHEAVPALVADLLAHVNTRVPHPIRYDRIPFAWRDHDPSTDRQ